MSDQADTMGLTDPLYTEPFVDVDEWRDEPVRHRYVHGGFEGNDCRFSVYFPEARRYDGRFFNPLNAIPGSEHSVRDGVFRGYVEFAAASGGYLVESNLGRFRRALRGEDSTVAGYRAAVAVATYSRVLARAMYGEHRPYGYVFGGSGGAYRTISCFEYGHDVWDGAVPYIHGTLQSMPSMFSVQAHAFRVLHDKLPQIVDALEPGGSGDMYAGLTQEEREALAEATRLGYPIGAWFDADRVRLQYSTVWAGLFDHFATWDPTYFDDFWTVPGYLGANPTASLADAKVQHKTKIAELVYSSRAAGLGLPVPMAVRAAGSAADDTPVAYRLEEDVDADLTGAMLHFASGRASGHHVWISGRMGGFVTTGIGQEEFEHLRNLAVGDDVVVDNTPYLAFQTYHRHQVPDDLSYEGWDQFRAAGRPIFPQRPQLIGPRFVRNNGAGLMSGRFAGKMIIVQNLCDEIAYPQQADWYRRRVRAALGKRFDDHYRVWFTANAMHGDPAVAPQMDLFPARGTRIVGYRGVLEQALRDVAAWAERGIAPPASTSYELVDGQIVLPETAAARGGIQPVVHVTANGEERAEVSVGEAVRFSALAEVPPGGGIIVAAQWDFEGDGDYPVVESLTNEDLSYTSMTITREHAFTKPGTYFPALRVTSQRLGQGDNPHGRVMNLGRVRVVVA
ncbi:MAG TPA: PKD domain-containing protein [Acidimicrobiia bacterium]